MNDWVLALAFVVAVALTIAAIYMRLPQHSRPYQGGAMKQTGVVYCSCAHKIRYEVRDEEDFVHLAFFDDEETNKTYGEQITQCPGCGGLSFTERLLEPPKTDV